MIVLDAPADLVGDQLAAELTATGIDCGRFDLYVADGRLIVNVSASEQAVAAVVAAHVPEVAPLAPPFVPEVGP